MKTLRDLDALLAPGPAIEGIERRLPSISDGWPLRRT